MSTATEPTPQDVYNHLIAAKPGDVFSFEQAPGRRVLVVIAHAQLADDQPDPAPQTELCSDKNGFHDGHDWTPDPCEPYRWCPGYPVPASS